MAPISISKARDQLAELASRAAYGGERTILQKRGKGIAAVVPIEDLELLEMLEERQDLAEAHKALSEAKKKGTIPWKRIKADLGL